MSNKKTEQNEQTGPVARDSNPERFGNGGAEATQQGSANQDTAARNGAGDPPVGSEQTGPDSANSAQSATGETGGANPGTAAPQDVVQEPIEGRHPAMSGDPIIDRDPGDETFMREHGAGVGDGGTRRSVDRSEDYNQERDTLSRRAGAIEGLQDGPGGRKYLILNLTDDTDAQNAARAYAEAIRKDPKKADLAAQLFRLAGVNVARL